MQTLFVEALDWKGATPAAEGVAAGAASPSAPVVGSRRLQACRQRVLSRQQPERDRNLPPSRHAQLLPQHVAMRLRRPRRDAETASDLLVRATVSDQLDHLTLPIRDDGRALMQDFDHGGDGNNGLVL